MPIDPLIRRATKRMAALLGVSSHGTSSMAINTGARSSSRCTTEYRAAADARSSGTTGAALPRSKS
nr:hypothetical protein [Mycolicibacterium tusciae]